MTRLSIGKYLVIPVAAAGGYNSVEPPTGTLSQAKPKRDNPSSSCTKL
jgi:hypothetical protein